MAVDLDLFIEYRMAKQCSSEAETGNTDFKCLPLDDFSALKYGKDYLFMGAIAGVRSRRGEPWISPRRCLPSDVTPITRRIIARTYDLERADDVTGTEVLGWLTLDEITESLKHQEIERTELSLEAGLVLEVMETIAQNPHVSDVRLIFGIE